MASYPAYYLHTATNAAQKKQLCKGRGMGYAHQAAHHEVEDGAEDGAAEERRPCVDGDSVDGDRGSSLRVVSGATSAGCILGAVGGRCSVLRRVRAVDVHGYICSGGDGRGGLLSRPRPLFMPLFPQVRGRMGILRSSPWIFCFVT